MPSITLTLTAAHAQRVEDAICAQYDYQETIDGAPNPETRAQFTKRKVAELVKERVQAYERDASFFAAQAAAQASPVVIT